MLQGEGERRHAQCLQHTQKLLRLQAMAGRRDAATRNHNAELRAKANSYLARSRKAFMKREYPIAVHKSPRMFPILRQSTPSHPIYFETILILSSFLRSGLPSGFISPGFYTRSLCVILTSPIHDTSRAILIIIGSSPYEVDKTRNS